MIYLIGSLRNPRVPLVAQAIRDATGLEVFDDWFAAGPEADDYWQRYEQGRGHSFVEALQGHAARNTWRFDRENMDRAKGAVLVLPAGKSGHLEFGFLRGRGVPGWILLPPGDENAKLPENWRWLAGVYEGEGSITRNGKRTGHGLQLTVTMYRWAVRKRKAVLFVARGIWDELGERRKAQMTSVLGAAGVTPEEWQASESPMEFRWDVMYQFATGMYNDLDELVAALVLV